MACCCPWDYIGMTVAAASVTGLQALVGIIWNVLAIMMFKCEVTFTAHGPNEFLSYLEYVRERYFFDERTCHLIPRTTKGWSFATNLTNVSMGGSALTQPDAVQIWIVFYLALNIIWLISVAPLILGIASRRSSPILPWTAATSATCIADIIAAVIFSIDLTAPVARYEASMGTPSEAFFGNRLAAAMFLPIMFARGITVWICNVFCLFTVLHVLQRINSGKPLTDAERLGKVDFEFTPRNSQISRRTVDCDDISQMTSASHLNTLRNSHYFTNPGHNIRLSVPPQQMVVHQSSSSSQFVTARTDSMVLYDNAATLPASDSTVLYRPYRPQQFSSGSRRSSHQRQNDNLIGGYTVVPRHHANSLTSSATKKKNRRSMPTELVINVDPDFSNSSLLMNKGSYAQGIHGTGKRSSQIGVGKSSAALVAASTPNLIDATKEFDFKRYGGSTGTIRKPNDPLPPIQAGVNSTSRRSMTRRPSNCSSSSESHYSLDRRGITTKRIHRVNETSPSPATSGTHGSMHRPRSHSSMPQGNEPVNLAGFLRTGPVSFGTTATTGNYMAPSTIGVTQQGQKVVINPYSPPWDALQASAKPLPSSPHFRQRIDSAGTESSFYGSNVYEELPAYVPPTSLPMSNGATASLTRLETPQKKPIPAKVAQEVYYYSEDDLTSPPLEVEQATYHGENTRELEVTNQITSSDSEDDASEDRHYEVETDKKQGAKQKKKKDESKLLADSGIMPQMSITTGSDEGLDDQQNDSSEELSGARSIRNRTLSRIDEHALEAAYEC